MDRRCTAVLMDSARPMNILALLADRISMPPKKKNLTNLHDKLFNGLAPKIFIIRLASGSPDKKYFIGACPLNYSPGSTDYHVFRSIYLWNPASDWQAVLAIWLPHSICVVLDMFCLAWGVSMARAAWGPVKTLLCCHSETVVQIELKFALLSTCQTTSNASLVKTPNKASYWCYIRINKKRKLFGSTNNLLSDNGLAKSLRWKLTVLFFIFPQ